MEGQPRGPRVIVLAREIASRGSYDAGNERARVFDTLDGTGAVRLLLSHEGAASGSVDEGSSGRRWGEADGAVGSSDMGCEDGLQGVVQVLVALRATVGECGVCSGSGVPARHQDFGQAGTGYLWTAGSFSRARSHQRHHQPDPALLATRLPRLLPDAHVMYPAVSDNGAWAWKVSLPIFETSKYGRASRWQFVVADTVSLGTGVFATRSLN